MLKNILFQTSNHNDLHTYLHIFSSAYGSISHSIIKESEISKGHKQYLIGNEIWHDSVAELVEYYYTHKLTYKLKGVSISLTYPVKRILGFEHEK